MAHFDTIFSFAPAVFKGWLRVEARFARMVVLGLCLSGFFTSSASADTETPRGVAIYVGGVTADFGGDQSAGLSVGVVGMQRRIFPDFRIQFSAEYTDKVNSGDVTRSSSADGHLIFHGRGKVSLKYLQLVSELQYLVDISGVTLGPYVGLGPTLLFSQSVATDESSGSTFSDFDWYGDLNVVALAGASVEFHRLLLDFQLAFGLFEMKSNTERAVGNWPGVPLFGRDGKIRSYRIAAGVTF